VANKLAIINIMDVNVAFAKNHLSELLKAVENGETVTISRYNKPVAQLGPIKGSSKATAPKFGMGTNIKILDPNWAKPMTKKQLEQFITTGRY
jgi:prevent-host-death family protein